MKILPDLMLLAAGMMLYTCNSDSIRELSAT